MEDKLTYYDIVAHLVPGTLVLGALALMPEIFGFTVPWPHSDLLSATIGIPVAYAVGQVVQGLSSMAQPIYYYLWGGKPSDVILEGKSPSLKGERLERVLAGLASHFNSPADTPARRGGLFMDAMALCNKEGLGRVDSFNASYAFHRALLTTGLVSSAVLAAPLILHGFGLTSLDHSLRPAVIYLLVLAVVLSVIEFIRAKQRGEYFSVEVLNMAYLWTRDAGTNHGA